MCDSATQQILEQIVREKVAETRPNGKSGQMFTALDISRAAQQNHGVRERHMNMKNDIHRLFSQGQMQTPPDAQNPQGKRYVRQTISLPGVPVDPWLYYPEGDDPTEYVSVYTGATPVAVVPAPVVPVQQADDEEEDDSDDDDLPDGVKRTDKRGRVWIPVSLLANLGLKPGDACFATRGYIGAANDKALSIKSNLGPSDTEAVVYKVDPHGNIAVSKGCLVEAGLDSATLEVTGDGTAVIVKTPTLVVASPAIA